MAEADAPNPIPIPNLQSNGLLPDFAVYLSHRPALEERAVALFPEK
jgi:hypothetical protein